MYVFYVERSGLTDGQRAELNELPVKDTEKNAIANCTRFGIAARLANEQGVPIGSIDAEGTVRRRGERAS